MMHVVIVYESLFGNTREVAEAVRHGIRSADPEARITCLRVAQATADAVGAADLLVVGGPTHMRRMTTRVSRKVGLQGEEKKADFHPEPDAEGPGVRAWFHSMGKAAAASRAAAFDTRVASRFAGGAAPGIARQLERHGYALVGEPEGFIVEDTEGPLREGELQRAQAWGARLGAAVTATV